jgi:hypothetical protein
VAVNGSVVDAGREDAFGAGVAFLGHTATATSLSDGILTAACRISEIVAAMRSYTYLDRGAWQTVDVTEGIESTDEPGGWSGRRGGPGVGGR